jgi:hypothetical protein
MSKRDQKKNLKGVKRRNLLREKSVRQELAVHAPPREIRNVLLVSYQLMDERRFAEAEELLTKERERRPNSPEILEALIQPLPGPADTSLRRCQQSGNPGSSDSAVSANERPSITRRGG